MADVTVKVLSPASDFRLMTLNEVKIALGITDTASDEQLKWQIEVNSATIAAMCNNRVFAREKVEEYWRCLQPPRLFLTHWPVKEADIESIECNGTPLGAGDYQLEEASGKILLFGSRTEPIKITYTGGFDLPDEAPKALKQACGLMVGIARQEQARTSTAGIRMIAHKESRVMFHNDAAQGGSNAAGRNTPALNSVNALLSHFMRLWV